MCVSFFALFTWKKKNCKKILLFFATKITAFQLDNFKWNKFDTQPLGNKRDRIETCAKKTTIIITIRCSHMNVTIIFSSGCSRRNGVRIHSLQQNQIDFLSCTFKWLPSQIIALELAIRNAKTRTHNQKHNNKQCAHENLCIHITNSHFRTTNTFNNFWLIYNLFQFFFCFG